VLVDIRSVVKESWHAAADAVGISLDFPNGIPHGMRPGDALRLMMPQLSPPLREQLVKHVLAVQAAANAPMPLIPGAARLLGGIPVDRWAIVTSAEQRFATKVMHRAGAPTPLGLITANDVENGKSDPEPFLLGAESLRIPEPSMCVAVESSPVGVQSAQRAGMRVVAVTTTFPAVQLMAADWVVGDLRRINARKIPDGLYVELA
jgi:mannitol-1-/sugar-/sorbitol-6-phosphatase